MSRVFFRIENTKKAVGIDPILPKLVEMSAEPLSQPVT